jgi:prophage DNA circulation protein
MRLVPAEFSGARYHVEQQARSGGRRVVLHEYPKRDVPYAEDMGRAATRYQITGYLIGPNYHQGKRALMRALDNGQGMLTDPYLAEPKMCLCERYNVTETRERGGYCTFEMTFVEVGTPGNTPEQRDSAGDVATGAQTAGTDAAQTANDQAAMVDQGATP